MKKLLVTVVAVLILTLSFLTGCDFGCGLDGCSCGGCTYTCNEGCTYADDAVSCFSPGQDSNCYDKSCSTTKSCVSCTDERLHCLYACPWECVSCTNHCLYFLNPAYCFMNNEQYEANCVNCIEKCGDDVKHCHPEYGSACDSVGCILDSNGGGVEISKNCFTIDAQVISMNTEAAGGYYNVIIDFIIKSTIDLQDVVCYIEVEDSDGNYIKLRKYVGEIKPLDPGTVEFTFIFKGETKDPTITNVVLTGR